MIESLVAILVLAVGLLGLAFLQAQGLKFNTSAYSRTQASLLAGDILDRMRLNAGSAAAYATTSPSGSCDPLVASVQNDINCWLARLGTALPSGTGSITDNGAGSYTVTVTWLEQVAARLDDGTTVPVNPALRQRNLTWTIEL